MLIVIGSDGNTLGSQVSKRFGRASYYIAYDTASELFEVSENNIQHETELEAEDEIIGKIGLETRAFTSLGDLV